MTSAYVNGSFVDGNDLDADDLNTFGTDLLAVVRSPSSTLGVGVMQPVVGPGLSMINPAYSGPTPIEPLQLTSGYGEAAVSPVTALPFTVECRVQGVLNGINQVAVGEKYTFWIGCDSNGYATGHYYGVGTGGEPGAEIALTTTTQITGGGFYDLCMVVTGSGAQLYVNGTQVASNTTPSGFEGGFPMGVRDFGGLYPTVNEWAGGVAEVAIWNNAKYTGNYTIATGPFVGNEPNLVALYHLQGDGSDVLAPASVALTGRPITATGVRFYLETENSDSVTFAVMDATTPPNDVSPFVYTICANDTTNNKATGPNWDEPFPSTINLFITQLTGTPQFRWM